MHFAQEEQGMKFRPAIHCGHPARALVLLLVSIATNVQADLIEVVWTADGRFERSVGVAPGKFAEVCDKLSAGAKVRWDFEASVPLDFNVHYHVGKEVVFPSKLAAVSTAKDTLDAVIDQHYCWKWSNKTAAAATVMVKMQR